MTLDEVLEAIEPPDPNILRAAKVRHDSLTKPPGSLGKLEALGVRLAGVYGTVRPRVRHKAVAVFAADHGVAQEGVSAYPSAVTAQMVQNFLTGGAAVNALSRVSGASFLCVDVGVDADFDDHPKLRRRKVARGSRNLLRTAALSADERDSAIQVGIDVALELCRENTLIAGGDMGIGNTTPAAALTAVMTRHDVDEVTGTGTGIGFKAFEHKRRVIRAALDKHAPDPRDPLEVLRLVGGLDIAALVGFYLGCAAKRAAVVLDGFIATSAALVAAGLKPELKPYLFTSHCSEEPGHLLQLMQLGLEPLFDLNLRLGEGSGAVLAMPILESAAAVLRDMATFGEAGVSGPNA